MKENERISFSKIENGFIVEHSYEEKKGKEHRYENKRFYTKTANDTKNKMIELQKKMKI